METRHNRKKLKFAHRLVNFADRVEQEHPQFTPRLLKLLFMAYERPNEGLTGDEIGHHLGINTSSISRLAGQLAMKESPKHPPLMMATFEREEGSGKCKVLRLNRKGINFAEELISILEE